MKVCIGIFAYNEQEHIARIIDEVSRQSLLSMPDASVEVHVLANGCTDHTIEIAEHSVAGLRAGGRASFFVNRVPFKGKSRTWNYFVHELLSTDVDYYIFMDADIWLKAPDTFENMWSICSSGAVHVVNSWPRKDLEFEHARLGLVEKAILKSGGNLTAYKTSICGQLYMVKGQPARNVYMPIGLPVEDGFLRAMLLTDLLTEDEKMQRITGSEHIYHVYESIRTIGELIRHQTRIMVGSAINEALFRYMRDQPENIDARKALLKDASSREGWLSSVVGAELPRWPYGFVSFRLLTKRFRAMRNGNAIMSTQLVSMMIVGFIFDFLVYVMASSKMLSGKGAGYW